MTHKFLLATLLALAGAPLVAMGSEPSADETSQGGRGDLPLFEVTPFAGLRLGGDFKLDDPSRKLDLDESGTFALALDLRIDDVSQYELFYGRQSTSLERDPTLGKLDVDIEYLHIGGTVEMEGEHHRIVPYMVGGLGATRFSPDPGKASDRTRFSLSLGGGVKVPFNRRFALRLEGRGYLTFVDTDTSFFCRSDEDGAACRIRGSGSTFLQFELLAGATFAF
jgi:Outer membrane protein beta-barrel domain